MAVDGWAICTARKGLGGATAHPGSSSLYKCNSPPINGHVPITVLLYNGPELCGFNVPIKGFRQLW